MNKKTVIALLVAAFLAGDFVAILRANRYFKNKIRKLEADNCILQLKLDACCEVFEAADAGADMDETLQRFNAQQEYIALVERM